MAGLPAAVRSGLLWPVRLLVVRAHPVGVGLCGVWPSARARDSLTILVAASWMWRSRSAVRSRASTSVRDFC